MGLSLYVGGMNGYSLRHEDCFPDSVVLSFVSVRNLMFVAYFLTVFDGGGAETPTTGDSRPCYSPRFFGSAAPGS